MTPKVDIVFKPVCLRFSVYQGSVVYYYSSEPYTQIDGMENLLRIDPGAQPIFDMNLGFLPVAHTLLIRGNKTILVDPNSSHISGYGMLAARLRELGSSIEAVDLVVNTHCHHDHSAGNALLRGKALVVGQGELEEAAAIYGPESVHAYFTGIMRDVREVTLEEGLAPLDDGVYAVKTPGHSAGSLCVLVDAGDERWALMGDTVMFRQEYTRRAWGHWYDESRRLLLNAAVDRVQQWSPTIVAPGHDRAFSTRSPDLEL